MLQLSGKCLGVKTESIMGPTGPFEKVTARIQSGTGFDTQNYDAQFGRDYPSTDLPREGEDVTLLVVVGAYSGRNGAGYRLTALSRVKAGAGARVSSVAS